MDEKALALNNSIPFEQLFQHKDYPSQMFPKLG